MTVNIIMNELHLNGPPSLEVANTLHNIITRQFLIKLIKRSSSFSTFFW